MADALPDVRLSDVERQWVGVDVLYKGATWTVVAEAPTSTAGATGARVWLCDGIGFTAAAVAELVRADYEQPELL